LVGDREGASAEAEEGGGAAAFTAGVAKLAGRFEKAAAQQHTAEVGGGHVVSMRGLWLLRSAVTVVVAIHRCDVFDEPCDRDVVAGHLLDSASASASRMVSCCS
jgi:hypothetical protein